MTATNYSDPLQAARRGIEAIGASQATINFTAVASGGTGLSNFTAAAHGLKKGQTVYIPSGTYAGTWEIKKVVSSSVVQIEVAFVSTTTGTFQKTASLWGVGFSVETTPLTIAEFTPAVRNQDAAAIIAKVYNVGDYVPIPFDKIRITAGNITCYRNRKKYALGYTRP